MNYVEANEIDEVTKKRLQELISAPKGNYWRKKRLFDIVISVLALIVLSPVLLLILLIVFLDDPHGSPVFKQVRVGRHGREFLMYKFRTMVVNAEAIRDDLEAGNEMDGPVFKIKNDPRITRVGKILRQTSADELLQFVNVLKGDMSMVGPRPPLPKEVEQYDDFHRLRLIVTPGLTCYWQTTPDRNEISFSEWVNMDLDYIEQRNMWIDLKLIFKTAISMFDREGR